MRSKITEYKTDREIAWRNLMVTAINAGIEAGFLSADESKEINGKRIEFDIEQLGKTFATFESLEYGEVSIEVVVGPKTKDDLQFTKFPTGAVAKAQGFMERASGFYLQPSPSLFQAKKAVQQNLYKLDVEPEGYEDIGRTFAW